jgi:hypothetical protein
VDRHADILTAVASLPGENSGAAPDGTDLTGLPGESNGPPPNAGWRSGRWRRNYAELVPLGVLHDGDPATR